MLDLDGTLLEIAETPSAVNVPSQLVPLLDAVAARLSGAVAVISGRPIEQIDRLLQTDGFVTAGLHGLEWRDATGTVHEEVAGDVDLVAAREVLGAIARRTPGVQLEDKGRTVALHYRRAPDAGPSIVTQVRGLAARLGAGVAVQEGKMVVEIKPAHAHKGTAVERLMVLEPFAGRCPVYLGDDVTDEDAFRAVNRLGGHSVRVGPPGAASRAQYSLAGVNDVYVWLEQIVAALPGKRGHGAG